MNAETALSVDRRAERTHLFLVATLYVGGSGRAVRVRNLSATGALIEAAELPPVGSEVMLRRALLEAPGTVAWMESGRAGLRLSGPIDVSAWLPTKERQSQVDCMAFNIKQGIASATTAPIAVVSERTMSMINIAAELASLQEQLGRLGDALSRNRHLVADCPELQVLDLAGQRIGKIVDVIRAL